MRTWHLLLMIFGAVNLATVYAATKQTCAVSYDQHDLDLSPYRSEFVEDVGTVLFPIDKTSFDSLTFDSRDRKLKFSNFYKMFAFVNTTVIDVGFDDGLASLYLARLVGKSGRVIAMDSSPVSCNSLEYMCHINAMNNIRIMQATPSVKTQFGVTYKSNKHKRDVISILQDVDDETLELCDKYDMELIRLIGIDSLGLNEVSFIRINSPKNEMETLIGAQDTILAWHPAILIRIKGAMLKNHQVSNKASDILDYIRSFGYSCLYTSEDTFICTFNQ